MSKQNKRDKLLVGKSQMTVYFQDNTQQTVRPTREFTHPISEKTNKRLPGQLLSNWSKLASSIAGTKGLKKFEVS